MAAKGSEMALALVVVLLTWHGVLAQSGCSNALMSLAPCLNFVTGNVTKPSSACCSSLSGVVQTQPQCLCTMVNGGGAMVGLAVNQTLALSLPSACNVQTQPISRCNGASGPTSSAASPASGPTSSAASPASAPVGSPSSDSTPSFSSSDDTPVTTKTPSTPAETNTPSTTGTGSKSTPSTTGASSGASTTSLQLPAIMLVSLTVSFALSATMF